MGEKQADPRFAAVGRDPRFSAPARRSQGHGRDVDDRFKGG